jgi:peroxiredoxin
MASLTGEYDVVTEVGIGLVNCILAVIHENENEAYPRLPHSLTVHVDDAYRGAGDPVPEVQRTGVRTRAEVQASTPTVSLPAGGLVEPIWPESRAPVRTAVRVGRGPIGPIGPSDPGSRRSCWPKISARVRLRAWLRDKPAELPEFLHGDLHLTAGLVRTELANGTFLGFDYSSGPDVHFEPAAGTSLTDEQRAVADQILRSYIRGDAEPVTFKVDLPGDVHRFDYALRAGGPRPSAMLMFRLSDRPGGPLGPASVTARFLPGEADFAVAIGRDYLLKELRAKLLADVLPEYTGSGTGYSVRIRPDWTSAGFDLQPGKILVTVSGSGSITYGFRRFAATDDWSFTVRQAVMLRVVEGSLMPAIDQDPEVELHDVAVLQGTIRDKARERIRQQLTQSLVDHEDELRDSLDVAGQLEAVIAGLNPAPPDVALTGVEIRADGVVVPGTVGLAPSRPVAVKRVGLNGLANALESWIPGGTIERFVWDGRAEEHRFVTEKRIAVVEMRCLTVQGTRVTRGGGLVPVTVEDCPLLVAALPVLSGLPAPPLPCRRPLLPLLSETPEGRVEVVGHYDPWATGLTPAGGPTNLLVHFADGSWADAATAIDKALAATRKGDVALVVVGVLDKDALAEAALATLDADATLLLTQDSGGSWSGALGTSKAPATVLVGPDGAVRWKDEGALDSAKLAKMLDEQLEPGGQVSWRALRTAVAVSDRAPDAPLRLGEGRELALRRLRGKPVVLSFWTSCSEPSIEQLRQLSIALEVGREDQPHVLGIGDGESPQEVADVEKREQLPFPLVPDPERLIARRYGVYSWPTMVQVAPNGRIEAADLGLHPGLSPCEELRRSLDSRQRTPRVEPGRS